MTTDTERLDWLESQLKHGWGDGFTMMPLDGGARYVRPWRKELEAQFEPDLKNKTFVWQPDIRTAIDEAMLLSREPQLHDRSKS